MPVVLTKGCIAETAVAIPEMVVTETSSMIPIPPRKMIEEAWHHEICTKTNVMKTTIGKIGTLAAHLNEGIEYVNRCPAQTEEESSIQAPKLLRQSDNDQTMMHE